MRQQTLQQAQSLFALLVDGHLQRVAVGRHGAQRVARRHHPGSGGGQQAGDLARAHAGGLLDQLALALRVQQRSRRHRAGRQLRKRIITGRFRRARSGVQRLRWSRDRQHGHGRRHREIRRRRKRQRDHRGAPETARRFRSTPAAAAARRHARRRGPAQQRGSPPAPRARSPRPHHRRTARPAVQAPAPIGARAPLAHPLHSALPAAQAAWFGQRNHGPDRGSDPDRRSGARYGSGARPAPHRQRWFPTAPPRSYSTRHSAGWPAPTHAYGTAASPGCAAARRRR